MARAVRTGLMGEEALEAAKRAFTGVVNSLEWQDKDIQIGAFLLMCTELQVAEKH